MDEFEKKFAKQTKIWQKALKKNKELGKGLKVGKVFRTQVADGYAVYEIVKIADPISKVKYRSDIEEDYRSLAVDGEGNILTSQLKKIIEFGETLDELFSKKKVKK